MRKIIFSILLLVFVAPVFAQTGTIHVNVSGIENNKGLLQIGLYNSEANFPIYSKVFKGIFPKATKSGISYTFKNIPTGTYALAVYHDENSDKELNKNMFGAPKEKYGFSKNKYGTFGPPDFSEVSFKVEKGKKITVSIEME